MYQFIKLFFDEKKMSIFEEYGAINTTRRQRIGQNTYKKHTTSRNKATNTHYENTPIQI